MAAFARRIRLAPVGECSVGDGGIRRVSGGGCFVSRAYLFFSACRDRRFKRWRAART
jgi:hypothetical protein